MRPSSPSSSDAPDLPRPSDLAAGETDLADLFGQAGADAPEDLGGRVLDAFVPDRPTRFRVPRGRFLPVGLVLLALAVGGIAWVSSAARDAKHEARARRGQTAPTPHFVVDEPGGPLFRGLEDFQSLDVGRPDDDEVTTSCGEVGDR